MWQSQVFSFVNHIFSFTHMITYMFECHIARNYILYVCMCMHTDRYIHTVTDAYPHISTHPYIYNTCTHTYIYNLCMSSYLSTYIYIYTYTYMNTQIQVNVFHPNHWKFFNTCLVEKQDFTDWWPKGVDFTYLIIQQIQRLGWKTFTTIKAYLM